jgi:hypothetical protein
VGDADNDRGVGGAGLGFTFDPRRYGNPIKYKEQQDTLEETRMCYD